MKRLLILFFSAATFQLSAQSPEFSIFLIGDAGEHKPYRDAVLELAARQIRPVKDKSAMVFLGDNIYPKGLPAKSHPKRQEMEGKLVPQLDLIKNTGIRGFVIPGNHDWAKGGKKRWEAISEQEKFIANYLNAEVFFPKSGCPGPVELKLNEDILLVALDTQWLLTGEESSNQEGCTYNSNREVLQQIDEIVEANPDKNLVFVAHHPVYTHGSHGGVYQFKQHLFPLTDMKKYLYLPLPVIGSVYPLYRKWLGNIQDATNARYRSIMEEMVESFEKHPSVIHAAGHEHALEHIVNNNVNYIVSGSGSKNEFVKKKGLARYVTGDNGFARIDYYPGGEIWLELWVVNKTFPEGSPDYRTKLSGRD